MTENQILAMINERLGRIEGRMESAAIQGRKADSRSKLALSRLREVEERVKREIVETKAAGDLAATAAKEAGEAAAAAIVHHRNIEHGLASPEYNTWIATERTQGYWARWRIITLVVVLGGALAKVPWETVKTWLVVVPR